MPVWMEWTLIILTLPLCIGAYIILAHLILMVLRDIWDEMRPR
jgi:hypothetical protein